MDFAKQSTRFDGLQLDAVTARKIKLLKLSLTIATPSDPKESEELTRIVTGMEGTYGKGKYCPSGPASCKDLEDLSKILAESRDPRQLLEAWTGWHAIARPMRKDFVRFVELSNQGARELGFKDTGALWRSKYDMPPDDFARELDRLQELGVNNLRLLAGSETSQLAGAIPRATGAAFVRTSAWRARRSWSTAERRFPATPAWAPARFHAHREMRRSHRV